MLLVIFVLLLALSIAVGLSSWDGFIAGFFTFVVGGMIAFGSLYGVSQIYMDNVPVRFDLSNLADGQSVKGDFFLGSGSVDSEPAYFYYSGNDQTGYHLRHKDAYYVTIFMDEQSDPYMIQYCGDYNTVPDWIFWPLPDGERYDCGSRDKVEFHVPKDSIKSNYILDAE